MIAALGIAEQHSPLADRDRSVPEPWLGARLKAFENRMIDRYDYIMPKENLRVRSAAHSHLVQSSIASMSFGAWSDDPGYFQTGIDQWQITLGSMRDDGSLPIETRRGARSIYYHGRTLAALVQLAERA